MIYKNLFKFIESFGNPSGILLGKKDVSLVNYARRYVLRKLLQLRRRKEQMDLDGLQDMTLICLNVSIVAFAKRLVQ